MSSGLNEVLRSRVGEMSGVMGIYIHGDYRSNLYRGYSLNSSKGVM